MSIRRTGLLLLSVLLVPAAAHATGHNMEASGGYSGASGSAFRGFHSVFVKVLPNPGGGPRDLSVLLDVSVYDGSENGKDQTLFGSMLGGRVTLARDPKQMATFSAHGLAGTMNPSGGPAVFAFAAGGAVDLMMGSSNSAEAGWGLRFMADYVVRHGTAPNLKRVSFQVVKRWGHHHQ
jgi:hypothetical protein